MFLVTLSHNYCTGTLLVLSFYFYILSRGVVLWRDESLSFVIHSSYMSHVTCPTSVTASCWGFTIEFSFRSVFVVCVQESRSNWRGTYGTILCYFYLSLRKPQQETRTHHLHYLHSTRKYTYCTVRVSRSFTRPPVGVEIC